MNFENLIHIIQRATSTFETSAAKAVNRHLTCRNWLIGHYIYEYEQHGEDRATYGSRLVDTLAEKIYQPGLGNRNLKLFRQFYLAYPELATPVLEYIRLKIEIVQTVPAQLQINHLQPFEIVQTLFAQSLERTDKILVPPDKLFNNLSFSHFTELLGIDHPLEKCFYEIECIKGIWSTRELRRQINSLF
jgi:hypothetical protein